MKYNIFLDNHSRKGKKSILDFVEWLYFKLKKNNLDVSVSKNIDLNSINILIDNFNSETNLFLKKNDIKYGIILTEILTENSMNYENSEIWKIRRRNFDKVEKNALFVFTMGPMEGTNFDHRYQPIFLEYLKEISKKSLNTKLKKNNFCYTGPINNFRKKILDKFLQFTDVEVFSSFLTKNKYSNLAQRSKYFLCIQQSENWPTVSITKIMIALHNDCIPVLLKMDKSNFNEISNFTFTSGSQPFLFRERPKR